VVERPGKVVSPPGETERPGTVVSPPTKTNTVDFAAAQDPLQESLVSVAPMLPAPLCPSTMLYTVILVSFFMAVGPALMVLNKEILDVVRSGSGFRV
jgi:hypothetical protein